MLKTKVILSSVTNLSDARYASGMGVDYIGFNINPQNDQYVTPKQVKMITEWLSGVKIIGNIDNLDVHDTNEYKTDFIQTSNKNLVEKSDNTIFTLDFNFEDQTKSLQVLSEYKEKVSFFVLNVEETDVLPYKTELSTLCKDFNIFISSNFVDDIINLTLNEIKPMGIVIYGSKEEQPGLSSYDGIADILEQIEID
jgi:phosphoribosylanthranilate isomerase